MEELRRWERRRTGGETEENNELLKLHGDEREIPRFRGEKRDPEGLCGEERERSQCGSRYGEGLCREQADDANLILNNAKQRYQTRGKEKRGREKNNNKRIGL
jgi:hypothetical protein